MVQDRLKLSREQKDHILSVRMRFLETMRHVMMQRRAAQEALELPLPAQYENEASLMHFAEVTLASEKSLLALCQQQKEAYRLIHYAVREVRCTPALGTHVNAESASLGGQHLMSVMGPVRHLCACCPKALQRISVGTLYNPLTDCVPIAASL